MPLPLIVAGIAIAAASGGGAGAGGVGVKRMLDAKERVTKAQSRLAAAEKETAGERDACELAFTRFGAAKLAAMTDALIPFHEAFSQLKYVDLTVDIAAEGAPALDEVGVTEIGNLAVTLVDALGLVAGAGAAGVTGYAATLGAVGAAAAASTGTPIAALSGVAATNATLAWLGGGTLAAGGGGVAAGTMVLTGLAAAPALLVGGVFLHHKGRKAVAKAHEYTADVNVAIAKHKEFQAVLSAAAHCARSGDDLLTRLTRRLLPSNGWLAGLVDRETDWRKLTDHEHHRIRLAATIAVAASNLVHTPVVDENGALTQAIRKACDQASTVVR